jgi:hypothetical protein
MLRDYDNGRVVGEDHFILVRDDGHYIEPVHNAKEDRDAAKRTLTRRLTPIEFFDNPRKEAHRERETVEIKNNTRLYNKETEEHLKADEFDIIETDDTECGYERKVTFIVDPNDVGVPIRTVTYYESDLEELLTEGTLVTRAQQADEIEAMLEEVAHAQ